MLPCLIGLRVYTSGGQRVAHQGNLLVGRETVFTLTVCRHGRPQLPVAMVCHSWTMGAAGVLVAVGNTLCSSVGEGGCRIYVSLSCCLNWTFPLPILQKIDINFHLLI